MGTCFASRRTRGQDLLAPAGEGGILGSRDLTFAEISRRFAAGARFVSVTADQSVLTQRRQGELLCAVSPTVA